MAVDIGYKEEPSNFLDIQPYIVWEKTYTTYEIVMAPKCYLYDACSFRYHANLSHPEYLFQYIKEENGIVIITRSILMELARKEGVLEQKYIEYIKKMHMTGIKVLVIFEEELFDVLNMCFLTNERINNCLFYAVRNIKTATGTITETLNNNESLKNDVVIKPNISDRTLFSRFFSKVRANKKPQDNLGEEMLAICVHMLSNIPERTEYKYVIMTDDKGAIGLIKKAAKNSYTYQNKHMFSAFSTPKMVQCLHESGFITQENEVEEMLTVCTTSGEIGFLGSEEYDLEIKEKTMSCGELARKIVTPNAIHINY